MVMICLLGKLCLSLSFSSRTLTPGNIFSQAVVRSLSLSLGLLASHHPDVQDPRADPLTFLLLLILWRESLAS